MRVQHDRALCHALSCVVMTHRQSWTTVYYSCTRDVICMFEHSCVAAASSPRCYLTPHHHLQLPVRPHPSKKNKKQKKNHSRCCTAATESHPRNTNSLWTGEWVLQHVARNFNLRLVVPYVYVSLIWTWTWTCASAYSLSQACFIASVIQLSSCKIMSCCAAVIIYWRQDASLIIKRGQLSDSTHWDAPKQTQTYLWWL